MKIRASNEVGIDIKHEKLPSSITENDLLATINNLNNDDSVHAILLQLPLMADNSIGQ